MSEAIGAQRGFARRGLDRTRGRLDDLTDWLADRSERTPPGWVLIVVLVAILTWAVPLYPPTSGGYDISWITALPVAHHLGLHWGSQFNYTYGPLSFLTIGNMYYDGQGLSAQLVVGALEIAVLVIIARPLCRTLGLLLGGLLVFVIARTSATPLDPAELLSPLIIALGIMALRQERPLSLLQATGISLLAVFLSLDKLSVAPLGIAVIVVLAIVAGIRPGLSGRERARAVGTLIGSYVVLLIVVWLLGGQSLFDLPAYFRNGLDFITGYADAEAVSDPSQNWQYTWVVVCTIVAAIAVYWTDRDTPLIRRVAIALLWFVFVFTEFRHAFVRFQTGHTVLFFGPLAILCAAVLLRRTHWRTGLVALLVALAAVWHVGLWTAANVASVSTTAFVEQLQLLFSPKFRHTTDALNAAALRTSYHLPAALISTMSGNTVQFDPWEAALAWAYPQIRWDPPPVFQTYNAFTSHLDDLNASFLAGPRAPLYILRQNEALDGRNPRFESPRYMLEMFCRYRQVMTAGSWELLERGPNRCGSPEPDGSQTAAFGQRVHVPVPTENSIVVGSFTNFTQPFGDTLAQLLFKRPVQYISTNNTAWRFVPGSASSPHVLSLPSCLGWSPSLVDTSPYEKIAIGHVPQLYSGYTEKGYGYQVTFERIPFNCRG